MGAAAPVLARGLLGLGPMCGLVTATLSLLLLLEYSCSEVVSGSSRTLALGTQPPCVTSCSLSS